MVVLIEHITGIGIEFRKHNKYYYTPHWCPRFLWATGQSHAIPLNIISTNDHYPTKMYFNFTKLPPLESSVALSFS